MSFLTLLFFSSRSLFPHQSALASTSSGSSSMSEIKVVSQPDEATLAQMVRKIRGRDMWEGERVRGSK